MEADRQPPGWSKRPRHIQDDLKHWARQVWQISQPPQQYRKLITLVLIIALSAGGVFGLLGLGLTREAAFMGGIFIVAALLWLTETIPLFATALLVIALEVVLLANPGNWSFMGFEDGGSPPYQEFLAPLADPVIWLFLGGFIIAAAAVKEGIDQVLAGIVLKPFQGSPGKVMFGLMFVTTLLSMFMSNTATTVMMMTLVGPVLAQIPRKDPVRKGMILSIPFAANVGGMSTPISSPPNAVAMGYFQTAGIQITFLEWMLVAMPLVILGLIFTWIVLKLMFRPTTEKQHLAVGGGKLTGGGKFVLTVILFTIGLWVTDALHGLPSAVVALVPVVAFTATGLLGREDFNSLEWSILILIAGGIALGFGMQVTGLDEFLVSILPTNTTFVLAPIAIATLLLGTFMSNTAAANLLLPVGAALASSGAGPGLVQIGFVIALIASIGMVLPVSTPPNAVAYSTGEIETRDMAISGGIIAVGIVTLVILTGGPIIDFWLGDN